MSVAPAGKPWSILPVVDSDDLLILAPSLTLSQGNQTFPPDEGEECQKVRESRSGEVDILFCYFGSR